MKFKLKELLITKHEALTIRISGLSFPGKTGVTYKAVAMNKMWNTDYHLKILLPHLSNPSSISLSPNTELTINKNGVAQTQSGLRFLFTVDYMDIPTFKKRTKILTGDDIRMFMITNGLISFPTTKDLPAVVVNSMQPADLSDLPF